jgi:hypothetical protein
MQQTAHIRHVLETVGEGKRVVIGESFRLSCQTDGLLLAGSETMEKNKSEIGPNDRENRHIDPGTPQSEI